MKRFACAILLSLFAFASATWAADPASPAASTPASVFQMRLVLEEAGFGTEDLPLKDDALTKGAKEEIMHVQKRVMLDHTSVKNATAMLDGNNRMPLISLEFTDAGAVKLAEVTKDNVNRRLAIIIDGKVLSAPVIRESITGGQANISGTFSLEEAKALASKIMASVKGSAGK